MQISQTTDDISLSAPSLSLINKLYAYGLCNKTVEWFEWYLTGRTQQCFINGHLSSPRVVSCGVRQGSILGPLFFLIYINELGPVV